MITAQDYSDAIYSALFMKLLYVNAASIVNTMSFSLVKRKINFCKSVGISSNNGVPPTPVDLFGYSYIGGRRL